MSQGTMMQKDTKSLFSEGVELYKRKDFENAEKKLGRALNLMPKSEDIMYNLALVYLERQKYDAAWDLANKIKTIDCEDLINALKKSDLSKKQAKDQTKLDMPTLNRSQKLDISSIRLPTENIFLVFVILGNILFFAFVALLWSNEPGLRAFFLWVGFFSLIFALIDYKFFYWMLYGNSVLVGPAQYLEIYDAVKKACDYIDLKTIPSVFVLQGHGRLELYLIKKFTARGHLVFTSDMIDKLLYTGDSRQLMMIIGRQLGHIRLGHYTAWFFTDIIGKISGFFYLAWKRKCNASADRVGLLVTGDLTSARKALLTMIAGRVLSEKTNLEAIQEQDSVLRNSLAARFFQLCRPDPYMIHRIIELRKFKSFVAARPIKKDNRKVIAALPAEVSNFHIHVHGQAIIGDKGVIKVSQD